LAEEAERARRAEAEPELALAQRARLAGRVELDQGTVERVEAESALREWAEEAQAAGQAELEPARAEQVAAREELALARVEEA